MSDELRLKDEYELIRVTRDHIERAYTEFDRALAKMGVSLTTWDFELDDPCTCGRHGVASAFDVYNALSTMRFKFQHMYDVAYQLWKDARTDVKRGTRRMNGVSMVRPYQCGLSLHTHNSPPTIQRAPRDVTTD